MEQQAEGSTPSEPLVISVEERESSVIARLGGDFDLAAKERFQAAASALMEKASGGTLVIDLRELTFIDSTGLGLLLQLDAESRRDGFALRIVKGVPAIHRAFEITGLDSLLPFVAESPDVGERDFGSRPGNDAHPPTAQHILEMRLDGGPDAPTRAREALCGVAEYLGSVADDILLLVSELVTNAVVHAKADTIQLSVRSNALDEIRVEVTAPGPTWEPPAKPRPGPLGGYGLVLVDRLAENWGVAMMDGESCVWFEVAR
jgi:anti-anti-sigma factor